jgi:hypothetical protein
MTKRKTEIAPVNNNKCHHRYRVSVHPSIVIGGVFVGKCNRDALPLMTVCAEHADRWAMGVNIRDLYDKWQKLLNEKIG